MLELLAKKCDHFFKWDGMVCAGVYAWMSSL